MPSCPYCIKGHKSTQILGWQFHQLSDRWIMCLVQPGLAQSSALSSETRPNMELRDECGTWGAPPQKAAAAS